MDTVFAALLLALTVFLFIAPSPKSLSKEQWLFRIQIEGEEIRFTQYLAEKEVSKKREVGKVRKVVKDERCYLLYTPNAGNIIVCQRNLLKKGTFEELESIFSGKIREAAEKPNKNQK